MDTCPPTLNPPVWPRQFLSAYPADLRPYLELPARPMLEAPALLASSSPSFLLGASLVYSPTESSLLAKEVGRQGSPSPFPHCC